MPFVIKRKKDELLIEIMQVEGLRKDKIKEREKMRNLHNAYYCQISSDNHPCLCPVKH